MNVDEAVSRIFVRHALLIILLMLAGVAAGIGAHLGDPTLYQASTRLILDTADPQTQSESASIADAARAIVTGRSAVTEAMRRIGLDGDVDQLAEQRISVAALGSSGVLELSVLGQDPRLAARLANSLAQVLIENRLRVSKGGESDLVGELDHEVETATRRIATIDQRLDELNVLASTGVITRDEAAERERLSTERDYLVQRRLSFESQEASLKVAAALRPRPTILDPASPPSWPEPSRNVADAALGAILGLVVGIGLASLLEAFRPTIAGREALEREVGAPVLGHVRRRGRKRDEDLAAASVAIDIARSTVDVDRVDVIPVGPPAPRGVEGYLKGYLKAALATAPSSAGEPAEPEPTADVAAARNGFAPEAGSAGTRLATLVARRVSRPGNGAPSTGVVVLAPTVVPRADVKRFGDLVTLAALPLLGIVTYTRRRMLLSGRSDPHRDANEEEATGQ